MQWVIIKHTLIFSYPPLDEQQLPGQSQDIGKIQEIGALKIST